MKRTFANTDGRTIGSLTVLQGLIAQLIAEHPSGAKILGSVDNISKNFEQSAKDAAAAGNDQLFTFYNDVVTGMDDTAHIVREYVASIRDGK
ncbi:hypothetical protein [Mesorhizobium sp. CN2-181]|uniref:hypothetical protein n=1 Tax=Mesorhizobium yinganensis TaxID=3157707 RepID=UPI0032B74617